MNTRRALFAALLLLMTALACVVPGLPTASQPAPTVDTRLDIMVAETVSAALAQTQQAIPTTTALPTSTATQKPTVTPSPTLTLALDSSGSSLTKLEDGTTQFVDGNGKYQFVTSSGWLPVRIGSQEYLDAWLLPELSNPYLQRSLGSIESLNPDEVRLFILDLQEGHAEIDFVTNISLYWDRTSDISLENDEDLQAAAATLPDSLEGLEVIAIEISATANGIPFGVITSKTPVATLSGVNVEMFQKQVFIKLEEGALVITLTTTEELKQAVLPQFDAMIETVQFHSETD